MYRLTILALSLILTLGSAYQAVLKLAHDTGTLVELCIDGQTQQVAIGPDGRPAPHTGHDCADCLLGPPAGLAGHMGAAPHAPNARALAFLPRLAPSQRGPTLAAAPARAPPAHV